MSPQRSNRQKLLDGALRCLERLPIERITARAIADESGANLASITYHFESKDALITAAVIEGLDRWLVEIERVLGKVESASPTERFRKANAVVEQTRQRHVGLVHSFVAALAIAPHEPVVRDQLTEGFRRTRPAVARLLGLGDDRTGSDAAGLALAMFYGQLLQVHTDPDLAVTGARFDRALIRLFD